MPTTTIETSIQNDAFTAALLALPVAEGQCPVCKIDRILVEVNEGVERYACPSCQVVVLEDDQVDLGGVDVVLRDPVDPHWLWLPESVRAACAREGFGIVSDAEPEDPLIYQLGVFFGTVWAAEGKGCLLNTGAPAADLATYEAQMPWGDLDEDIRATFRIPGGDKAERYLTHAARQAPMSIGGTPSWCMPGTARYVGCAIVQARYVRLLEALYPDGLMWHSGGERDPVAACVSNKLVAIMMPIIETRKRSKR